MDVVLQLESGMLMRVAFLVGLAGGSDCVAGLADLMVAFQSSVG